MTELDQILDTQMSDIEKPEEKSIFDIAAEVSQNQNDSSVFAAPNPISKDNTARINALREKLAYRKNRFGSAASTEMQAQFSKNEERADQEKKFMERGDRFGYNNNNNNNFMEDGEIDDQPYKYSYENNQNTCLGVFGLATITTQNDLNDHFQKYGKIVRVNLIVDPKSCISKGFGFIYFETHEQAELARQKTDGGRLHKRQIRVDFSKTREHKRTPGVYMGPAKWGKGKSKPEAGVPIIPDYFHVQKTRSAPYRPDEDRESNRDVLSGRNSRIEKNQNNYDSDDSQRSSDDDSSDYSDSSSSSSSDSDDGKILGDESSSSDDDSDDTSDSDGDSSSGDDSDMDTSDYEAVESSVIGSTLIGKNDDDLSTIMGSVIQGSTVISGAGQSSTAAASNTLLLLVWLI